MGTKFASGKKAIAECDVCGQRFLLKQLKKLIVKGKATNILACSECWSPDHPQLKVGMYPVYDPQALRNPRPDSSYDQSGLNVRGNPGQGSRAIQWGWSPVGFANPLGLPGLVNMLEAKGEVGTVTVQA
jgi:hypothetical protein